MNRRTFLHRAGTAAAVGLLTGAGHAAGGKVALVADPDDPVAAAAPAQWALDQPRGALAARGVAARVGRQIGDATPEEVCVVAAGAAARPSREVLGARAPDGPEALALAPGRAA